MLNPEIELTEAAKGAGYENTRRPDFYWPKYSLAMDYDSKEYHDELQRANADERRRNELSAMGLNSIIARKHHFKDELACDLFMGQLFSAMPRSMDSDVKELPAKRTLLFSQLFGRQQFRPMDIE